MVKRLLFLTLLAIPIASCSKDNIQEEIQFDNSTIQPQAQVVKPTEENEEELVLSSTQKTSNWVSNMQLANGLLESSENTDFVSLYDNALATLVFIQEGKLEKAEHILDFFHGKMESELNSGAGGFYQFRNSSGENGSRTWMGDNAWLLIAINHYHEATGSQKYMAMDVALTNWLRSLQDTDGSLFGGFNENGSAIPKVTEGILTAFNAVKGYDEFHKNILSYLEQSRWSTEENILVAWPDNSAYNHALDLHSLSYIILTDFPESTLEQANRYKNTQIATVTGQELTGYCFDDDKDVIWLEGTAQMTVAFNHAGNIAKANDLLLELEKTFISSTIANGSAGLPYTSNHGTTYGSNMLWDHADITPAVSSTAWYFFAKLKFNPFDLGKEKNMPDTDKFWMDELN